jgi:hypothetical protein
MDKIDILSKLIDAQRVARATISAKESTIRRERLKNASARSNMVYNAESGRTFLGNYKSPLKSRVVNISKLNPFI